MRSKIVKNPSLILSRELMARLRAALEEDVRGGDVTSQATISTRTRGQAVMRVKASGVICGLPVARAIFRMASAGMRVRLLKQDGARVEPGDSVLEVAGSMRGILTAERVALNFVQRMSGVATLTARYADAAKGTRAGIYDTRKTNPLWRDLDRYAVRCGGGRNHRYCLDDMILIKNNHVDACGSVGEAVRRAREWRAQSRGARPRLKIMAETRTLDEVRQALSAGADYIMLDNMSDAQIRCAVALIAEQVPVEVSGGVTVARARILARLGVDRISVGALTHSAPALDISLAYLR
ncbi:MAG: carboxylating nicotinate-nucleotide diphosphorylase [Candidatus Sumerlaeota bacterium]|nr:carboxylating nicotinate-nucleotide diphosphorylase [Candidatus Sumerlaeota bacterium]